MKIKLFLTSILIMISVFAKAQYTLTIDDVDFSNGEITKFTNTEEKDIIIPDNFNGTTVTSIGSDVFRDFQLISVKIPNYVTSIGYGAFLNNQLVSITIPNSVTSIGDFAFSSNQLTSISIPNSVLSIGGGAFNNNNLTQVNGITSNGIIYARNNDSSVDNTTIVSYGGKSDIIDFIPNHVTSIGYWAFAYNQLTSVYLPSSVHSLGTESFEVNRLTNISIPSSITSIGDGAFGHNYLTSVSIPNSVTSIGNSSFRGNQLTSIGIPNSVTSIGRYAFSYNKLISVSIPNSVTSIGGESFKDNQLMSVSIPNSVTFIGGGAFNNNNIEQVNGKTSNGVIYARNNDGSVDNMTIVSYGGVSNIIDFIPNSVTSIGEYAFAGNQLTSVIIPNSVTYIGLVAFMENKLTSIFIPNSITSIDNYAFGLNQLASVNIPISVIYIGNYAFGDNLLTSITLPVAEKEGYVFENWNGSIAGGTEVTDLYIAYTAQFTENPLRIDDEKKLTLTIYPNPASNFVTVRADKIKRIQILNYNGTVLRELTDSFDSPINIQEFKNGVYLLRVIANGKETVEKLVIK